LSTVNLHNQLFSEPNMMISDVMTDDKLFEVLQELVNGTTIKRK